MSRFSVSFHVSGTPAPQGSKDALRNPKTGKLWVKENNPATIPWRNQVAVDARTAMGSRSAFSGPVILDIGFFFSRPKNHSGRRGLLASAPVYKVTSPDIDKLVRAILDALTDIVYVDDRQVVGVTAKKDFTDDVSLPGAYITCTEPVTSRLEWIENVPHDDGEALW